MHNSPPIIWTFLLFHVPMFVSAYEYEEIQVLPMLYALLSLLSGLIFCMAGYRYLTLTLLATSFTSGALLAYLIASASSGNTFASWDVFLICGLLAAGVASRHVPTGLFGCGSAAGLLLGVMFNTLFLHRLHDGDPDLGGYVLCPLLGFAGGILAIRYERPFLLLSISYFGAFAFVWGCGYCAGSYPGGLDLKRIATFDEFSNVWDVKVPQLYNEFYVPLTVVLTLVGLYVQHRNTAKGLLYRRRRENSRDSNRVLYPFNTNTFV